MAGILPPVVATLVADTKEYSAKMDEATGKMEAFGAAADTTGSRFGAFASKASTAVVGAGLAIGAVGVDLAVKFQTALDQVRNTTNATAATIDKISKSATNLSNTTVNSATDIVGAYQAAEEAGYKWANAENTVTAAAKLAQITQQSVVDTTKSLIAAQSLGITKGMSAAKVADTLDIALKGNESSLGGVVAILQGKVGAALAGYHQSLGEGLAIANEFSKANFTNTRQIASFITKLGEFSTPMKTVSDYNGKLTVSTAGWVNSLVSAGLNATKVKEAFTGPDGLVNGLQYLKTTADGSLPKLTEYLDAVFGSGGTPAAMALVTNLKTISATVKATTGASAGGLNRAFNLSQSDIDNQLKELKNQAENILRGIGMFLLPSVTDVAHWTEDVVKFFKGHPLVSKIASDAAIATFGAAVAYKIGQGIYKAVSFVKGLFTGTALTANTAATQANTDALLGKSTGGLVGGATTAEEGGAVGLTAGRQLGLLAAGVVSFVGTTELLRHNVASPRRRRERTLWSHRAPDRGEPHPPRNHG